MKLHTIKWYIFGAVVGLTLGTTFLVNAGAFTAFTGMTQAWFDAVKLKLDGTYTSGKMCTSDASGTIQCITDVPSVWWGLTGNAGTTPGTNYIGTSDNQDVVFKRNGVKAWLLSDTSYNTSWGVGAFSWNTSGTWNTAIGWQSLLSNTSGNYNTAVGGYAFKINTTWSQNTAVGMQSLFTNTTWNQNTAVGMYALFSNNTGATNTAIGHWALYSNTTGYWNTANWTSSLYSNTTGYGNTALGYQTLFSSTGTYNTALWYKAGDSNIGGTKNTLIWTIANTSVNNLTNATALGYGAVVDASNKVRIWDAFVTVIQGQVAWSTTSDRRWKDNIQDVPLGLAFIKALRPVDYFRKNDESKSRETGFIAQEVESVLTDFGYKNSGMLRKDKDGYYSLRYNDFIAPVVKSIQEISTITEDIWTKVQKLEDENKALKSLVCLDHPSAELCK